MKQSIAYLPKRKQSDLLYLVKVILKKIPQTQMIILYGSYATGKYVEYDERVKEDIDALMPKIEQLRELVKRICEQRIQEYGEMK